MQSSPSIFTILLLIVFGVACLFPISESGQSSFSINKFWKELQNMSQTDFINKYVNGQSEKESYSQRDEISDLQQGNAPNQPASRSVTDPVLPCYPMNISVEIPRDPDPNVVRVPPCTVLPRCGGCCGSVPAVKCLPSSTSTVPVTVYRGVYNGENFTFSLEILSMEVHTACSCMCSIKPSDCSTDIHNYDSSTCSCQCKNESQAASCGPPKIWNGALCRCVCQHIQNCLEDEVFDFHTCKCEARVKINQRGSPAGLSLPAEQACRPGFTQTVVSGVRVCQPSSLPSNPRSIRREFPFSSPDQRRRR